MANHSSTERNHWDLTPGEAIRRRELHARYGGNGQAGITRSSTSPNVFIFTDLSSGSQHGYVYDGWSDDGSLFLYTGMGQTGDQQLTSGNAAIANHASDGRTIRLFDGVGGLIRYVGAFTVDPEQPYEERQAPATGGGPMRKVLVFRLQPDGPVWRGEVTFDEQWDALCVFLQQRGWWESLGQPPRRYIVLDVQEDRVGFGRDGADRTPAATKAELRRLWDAAVAGGAEGTGPRTRSRSALLAQLPNIEYRPSPLALYSSILGPIPWASHGCTSSGRL